MNWTEAEDLPGGTDIGRYRIIRRLARGGMGTIYLAERADGAFERLVALKIFRSGPAGLSTDEVLERFLGERQLLASLSHPHIAALLDGGETPDGRPYFVMEYVRGTPITDYCDERNPNAEKRLGLLLNVAGAVDYAHRHGVVHRDLKPANILVDEDEQVRLLDFGIAKLLSETDPTSEVPLTRPNRRVLTPEYASPEQLRGGRITTASDVYQLGLLLCKLLTGGLPDAPCAGEESTPLGDILAREPEEAANARRSLLGNRARDLEAIACKALRSRPPERYHSAAELAEDIRRCLAGRPVKARIGDSGRGMAGRGRIAGTLSRLPGGGWLVHHGRAASVIGAILMVVALAATLTISPPAAPVSATRVAVFPFSIHGDEAAAYLSEGLVDLLSTKLDGVGSLRSVDPRAILSALEGSVEANGGLAVGPSPERGAALARRFGAGGYILGSVTTAGGLLRIHAAFYRPTGDEPEIIAEASAQGAAEQLFKVVDELTAELLAARAGEGLTRLAALTTPSFEALKAYLNGEQALRDGRYDLAIERFREAVGMDTTFALAYFRLGVAASWAFRGALSTRATRRAVRFSDQLSERYRELLRARLAYRRGAAERAESLYRSILGRYPENQAARYQLGEVLFHYNPFYGKPVMDALPAFRRARRFDPARNGILYHRIQLAAYAERLSRFDSLSGRLLATDTRSRRVPQVRALRAVVLDNDAAFRRSLDSLRLAGDFTVLSTAYNVAIYGRDLAAARPIVNLLVAPSRPADIQALGHIILAELSLARGRWEEALARLTAARHVNPMWADGYQALLAAAPFMPLTDSQLATALAGVRRIERADSLTGSEGWYVLYEGAHQHIRLYLMGLLNIRLGGLDRAGILADSLAVLPDPPDIRGLGSDMAATVRAVAAFSDNRYAAARRLLDRPRAEIPAEPLVLSPFLSRPRERYLRARMRQEAGQSELALSWYQSLMEFSIHELIYVAPAHFGMAEIFAEQGKRDLAIEHYTRFLQLWDRADPMFQPRLERARRQLDSLLNGASA